MPLGVAVAKSPSVDAASREESILKYMPLVHAVARGVRRNLPVHADFDDLVQAGVLGLFDAVEKFDPEKKVGFQLYAKHRIRGAILDSLRRLDWVSRDSRKRQRSIEAAQHAQAQKLGRAPTDQEVASEVGWTEEEVVKRRGELQALGLGSGNAYRVDCPGFVGSAETAESGSERPDEACARRQTAEALEKAMATLPPRYRTVVRLYYAGEVNMKKIGEQLGVNESRVSQIHKSALSKLAAALQAEGYSSSMAVH